MKRSRPSFTSTFVAMARAIYDQAPPQFRPLNDPLAKEFVPKLARRTASAFARGWAVPAASRDAMRWVSFGMFEHLALRTRAIDVAIAAAIERGATQFVVLGAGLDSRAWRLPCLASCRVFEVDHPVTQPYKLRKTQQRVPVAKSVQFVSVDFERERLSDRLLASGFDAGAPTVWLLEGVSMYLPHAALEDTLRSVAELSPAATDTQSSTFMLTYSVPKVFTRVPLGNAAMHTVGHILGEPFVGLIRTDAMHAMLQRTGHALLSDETTADWTRLYLPTVDASRVWSRERLAVTLVGR